MLSTTVEHALRALAHMASLPAETDILGRDLASAAEIPPNYLSKILSDLRNAGLIDATRGNGGGYRLRKPAKDIRLIDIVELFDRTMAHPACLLGGRRECSNSHPCEAHAAWRKVREAYLEFLNDTTIESLASPKAVSKKQVKAKDLARLKTSAESGRNR